MTKRTVLITGCTSGIGKATAEELAKLGFNLILVSRNAEKLNTLKKELRVLNPKISLQSYPVDFQDFPAVVAAGKQIASEQAQIDVLINNAGIWENKLVINDEGIEMTWAVNYFAPYLLTELLLPKLITTASESKDGRIIIMSSEAHRRQKLNLNRLNHFQFSNTYGQTKLADLIWSNSLARRLDGKDITVNAVHPGVIATALWQKFPKPINWFLNTILAGSTQGAKTPVFLASTPDLKITGKYWADEKQREPSVEAQNTDLQIELETFTRDKLTKFLTQ